MSKAFFGFIFFLVTISIFKFLPFHLAGFSFLVLIGVVIVKWPKYKEELIINSYRQRIEDVFIIGRKKDGTPWEIPAKFKHLVVQVKWNKVMEHVARHQYYMEQAENDYYNDDKLPSAKRLQVIGLIKGDGEFVYESDAEFLERCIDTFIDRGVLRHKTIRKQKPEYYHTQLNFQKGKNWKTDN